MLSLYREPGDPEFDAGEIDFLREVSPLIAEGTKRGLLLGEASDPEGPEAPGLVILRADWSVESLTAGVAQWLDELPGEPGPPGTIAPGGAGRGRPRDADRRGRAITGGGRRCAGAYQRRSMGGAAWGGADRGRPATGGGHHRVRSSRPNLALLMAAYGLTEREQEVTRLVLQGLSTVEIAERLFVAPQTVQQHLKRVFDKTGVRSRRELVGKIFFAFYEPRVHDNEQRVTGGRPLRGGPMDPNGVA